MKKLFGIIIAALVLLTACDQGAHGESPPASSTEAATVNAPQRDGEMGSVRYQPTEVAVEDCYGQITDLCAVGQWVYFLAPVKVGETTIADWETGEPVSRIETQPGLFRLDLTTLEVQALPDFSFPAPAEDSDCSAGLQFLQAGADGTLWALRHVFSYSTSQQSYELLQISLEGQVERALPLPYASVEAFVPGEDGRLYVQWDSTISVLLPDGTEVQTLPVEQAGGSLCRCADALGVRYLSPRPGEEMQQSWFAALDLETLRWQEPAVLPGDGANLCAAPGGTDLTYIYLSPRSGDLYGDAQGETVKVVDFLSCGVDPREVTQVVGLEPGATVLPRSYTRQEGKAFLCESLEAFVDWEAGRCRFESPAFLALLRLVASLPEEAAQLEEPWLTQEGLLEDSTYFPVLREELEQLFQSSMEVRYSEDADGTLQPEVITSYRPIDAQGRQGETIQVNALTPAQAETVMALIGETRDVARTDPALQEIVLDELDYYLAGAHTAEETAANIQSRASVYVAERST